VKTAAAKTVLNLADYVAGRGADRAAFLAAVGVSLETRLEARVPAEKVLAAVAEAVRLTGDPALGLHIAAQGDPRRFELMGYISMTSATLGEAYARSCRYIRLWNSAMEIDLVEEGERATLRMRLALPGLTPETPGLRQLEELGLASMLLSGRYHSGAHFAPREVHLFSAAPKDPGEHRALFEAPVYFGRPAGALILDRASLALPIRTSDPELCAILTRHAEELLVRLPAAPGRWSREVRAAVGEALRDGCEIGDAARRLGVTPRTLQRRLREEGTSYQALVEEMRRELARRYLGERRLSLPEVARLLGFTDESAFYRAFRRWEGVTPAAFRKAAGSRQ
jgi:AraC-like DNA-binding protein